MWRENSQAGKMRFHLTLTIDAVDSGIQTRPAFWCGYIMGGLDQEGVKYKVTVKLDVECEHGETASNLCDMNNKLMSQNVSLKSEIRRLQTASIADLDNASRQIAELNARLLTIGKQLTERPTAP